MKVLALNGSARKEWNSALMLKSAVDGAKSVGAETTLIHLYDLDFKGCTGCHACKLKDSKFSGRCAQKDALSPVLEQAIDSDVILLASPIYFSDVTGVMRCFIERFLFPTLTYNKGRNLLYPKRIKVGLIYTTNAPESFYTNYYDQQKNTFNWLIGDTEYISAAETLQFTDYSKYLADMIDESARRKRREEVFPEELKTAFELGSKLASS